MSMTTVEAAAWREDMYELEAVLIEATKQRPARSSFMPVSGELGWVAFERIMMHDAVNRIRARYGRAGVSREDVGFAERRAVGHVDYVAKFAMGAADLVHTP